jgi:hypothetical protein
MIFMPRRFCAALLLFAVPLVSAVSAEQKSAQSADMQAVAAYKLTMPMVHKVMAAMRTMVDEMKKDPAVRERLAVEQEIAKLEEKVNSGGELTPAEEKRMEDLQKKQEAFDLADDDGVNAGGSIAEMEASIRKQPALLKALQSQGIAPKEYATFMMAYIQAAMIHGLQKQGQLKEIPAGVNVENVKFMAEHEAELAEIQKQMKALGQKPAGK